MEQLIEIKTNGTQQLVDARNLHEFLESKRDFSNWIKERIDKFGFEENKDFTTILLKSTGGRPLIEYALTMDMAKELSMVENNEKGRQARRYFIEKEKEANNPSTRIASLSKVEILQLALEHAKEVERLKLANTAAEKNILMLQPKADLMDQVMHDDRYIDIGQTAKILELPFGRNILFKKLRETGILFKDKNEPKQVYIEKDYFKLKEQMVTMGQSGKKIILKVLVTQKGMAFIANLFNALPGGKQMAKIN